MRNVNSVDLEYAACISADGLTLFLTRVGLSMKRLVLSSVISGRMRGCAPPPWRSKLSIVRASIRDAISTRDESGMIHGALVAADAAGAAAAKVRAKFLGLFRVRGATVAVLELLLPLLLLASG